MQFDEGQTVVRRCVLRTKQISAVESGRVISDDQGMLMWVGEGSAVMRRTTLDGSPVRKLPVREKLSMPTMLTPSRWHDGGVLILTPPDARYSVWWFFNVDGVFRGWYINLEEPIGRWHGGYDLQDHALDIWVYPDRSWQWKDEDEFADRTGHPSYWTEEEVPAIRAEGERLIAIAQRGCYPFDGSHIDFKPDRKSVV